jgi:hypothetical protein
MFNKKTLSVAIAAATVSMGANALVDMDATTPTVSTYAAETLSSADTTTGSGSALTGTFYDVVDAGTNLDIQTELGVGVSSTNQLFVRFDLSNAVWSAGTAPALTVGGAGATVAVAQGGGLGDSFVIFSLTATGDLAAGDTMVFAIGELGVAPSGSTSVAYAAYETLTAAINQGQSLYTNSVSSYVSVAPGASGTFTPGLNTAEVTTDFKEFTAASLSSTLANIGDLTYAAVTGVFDADTGAQVTVGAVADEANTAVTLAGDFSFGSWFLSAATNCATSDVDLTASIPEDGTTAEADLIEFGTNGFTNLCVNVDGTEDIISEGSYTASATVAPANASAVVAPANVNGTIGTIERNGTTVQAPYITTFADYNQRIILVNRGNTSAPYMTSFTPEAGVTVTAGAEAMGTLAPGETKVIRAADFATIEGGTRTAATIVIVAPPNNIDAATTQVNLADGGTDTVVLF